MPEAFIFDAIRTPRGKGKADGRLHEVKPITLTAGLLKSLQARNQLDTSRVDDVVMGCVTPVGEQGACLPKVAALVAGWDWNAAGLQINRFCASGLEAVNLAAQKVRSGWEDLVVAGGVESMSRVPMMSDGGAWALDPRTSFDTGFAPQGIGADLIATLDGRTREDVDRFAMASHQRAALARSEGRFARSMIPVLDASGQTILAEDEHIKPGTTLEGLGQLKVAFEGLGDLGFDELVKSRYPQVERVNHVHTAGNSSGIVDGAALVLVGNERAAHANGLVPRAKVLATALAGDDPMIMLTAPALAARKALDRAGLRAEDIDLYEVNEAFASVVLRFMQVMGVSHEKVNVNGGAIAMGHPLGASGAMLLGTLLDELERRDLRRGMVTLCVGGGMGIATIIERV